MKGKIRKVGISQTFLNLKLKALLKREITPVFPLFLYVRIRAETRGPNGAKKVNIP